MCVAARGIRCACGLAVRSLTCAPIFGSCQDPFDKPRQDMHPVLPRSVLAMSDRPQRPSPNDRSIGGCFTGSFADRSGSHSVTVPPSAAEGHAAGRLNCTDAQQPPAMNDYMRSSSLSGVAASAGGDDDWKAKALIFRGKRQELLGRRRPRPGPTSARNPSCLHRARCRSPASSSPHSPTSTATPSTWTANALRLRRTPSRTSLRSVAWTTNGRSSRWRHPTRAADRGTCRGGDARHPAFADCRHGTADSRHVDSNKLVSIDSNEVDTGLPMPG
jgi:hypothetical protein